MNQTLKAQYEKVKKENGHINLDKREKVVLRLVKDKEKTILWQYLYQEVLPLLGQFKTEDADIIHLYLKSFYETVLGKNLAQSGFKIVTR